MTKEKLQQQIINDLKQDYPKIDTTTNENEIIIKADNNTLWEIFEVLYQGLDNVELNLGKEEDAHIIIKT